MTPQDKKEISEALIEAMNKENLHTRGVAEKLNLNPSYISMAKNPNYWDSMGKLAWERLEKWLDSRLKISEFQIPEGEELWKPNKKTKNAMEEPVKPLKVKDIEHDDITPGGPQVAVKPKKEKKEKNRKSVKPMLNQREMAKMNQRVESLEEEVESQQNDLAKFEESISDLKQRIEDVETGISHLVTIPKPEPENKPGIIIFQRNIYKP